MTSLSPRQRAILRRNRWGAVIATFVLLTILNFVYDSGAAILACLACVCSGVVLILSAALDDGP